MINGVGGPAIALQGGRRRRCTNYGWPVGPTLRRRRGGTGHCPSRRPPQAVYQLRLAGGPDAKKEAWGDRPLSFKEAAAGGVPTTAGRWARREYVTHVSSQFE